MPIDALPRVTDDSRRHVILRALRDAIVTGQLQPGDRLVEREISVQMNISRGPVREALRQLEQEGLTVSYPYRGTEVASVSFEEISQVLVPIRLVLERFAVQRALPRLTEADLDELDGLVTAMRIAAQADDYGAVVESDMRFHELLLECADQPHSLQIWRTIAPRVRVYFHRDAPRHKSLDEVPEGHQQLLDDLRGGDLAHLDAVLERHIQETFDLKDG